MEENVKHIIATCLITSLIALPSVRTYAQTAPSQETAEAIHQIPQGVVCSAEENALIADIRKDVITAERHLANAEQLLAAEEAKGHRTVMKAGWITSGIGASIFATLTTLAIVTTKAQENKPYRYNSGAVGVAIIGAIVVVVSAITAVVGAIVALVARDGDQERSISDLKNQIEEQKSILLRLSLQMKRACATSG